MAHVRDIWKDPERRGSDKRWVAVWIAPDGKKRSKAFTKRIDADRFAGKQEHDGEHGSHIDPKARRTTVAQWCETWLAGYATRQPSTVRQARVHIAQIRAEFGDMPLGAIRPRSVYALHRRLSQIMGDAAHDGLIAKSPCSRRTSLGTARLRGDHRAGVGTSRRDAVPAARGRAARSVRRPALL